MSIADVRTLLQRIEAELAQVGDLNPQAQQAIADLLNLVEHLVSDQESLLREVARLKQQLDHKKHAKTTRSPDDHQPNNDHSSEKRRKQAAQKPRAAGAAPLVQEPDHPRNNPVSGRSRDAAA